MEKWREELYTNTLYHHGVKDQKWGVRRYQNDDGSLTPAGAKRYGVGKLDSSNRKGLDKLSEEKRMKKAKRELKKLYRKVDSRSEIDKLNAAEERDTRATERQAARDQRRQDMMERKAEQKKWDDLFADEEEDTDDKWWLSDEEKAEEKAQKAEIEAHNKRVQAAKERASVERDVRSDEKYAEKNDKQYQEEIRKIESGQKEAKRIVDRYIQEKYGLSKTQVSKLGEPSKLKKKFDSWLAESERLESIDIRDLDIDLHKRYD